MEIVADFGDPMEILLAQARRHEGRLPSPATFVEVAVAAAFARCKNLFENCRMTLDSFDYSMRQGTRPFRETVFRRIFDEVFSRDSASREL